MISGFGCRPNPTMQLALDIMKYRAICPKCGARFPRSSYFGWHSYVHRRCNSCGSLYTADLVWEHIGSVVLGLSLAAPAILADQGLISWFGAGVTSVLSLLIGYLLYPYITKFVVVEAKHELSGSTPIGLCREVHPLFRFFAGTIGLVGVLGLGLIVFMYFIGKSSLGLSARNIIDLALFTALAVYGLSIAIRGKIPSGILPWK